LLATVTLGWDSGFHYYLLMFIPSIFISTNTRKAVLSVFVLWCFYIGLNMLTAFVPPLEPLPAQGLIALRYFNISVVFLMFAYLSSYYYRSILGAQERLRKLAITDPLTGLYNRRHALDLANYEATQQKRKSDPLSFIIADVDHFKHINDTYGHDAGDAVLIEIGKAIRMSIREQDSASRWGGEEFMVVLPQTDLEAAMLVAERIRARVAATDVPVDKHEITTSITLGVSCFRMGETISNVIARADHALYEGKKTGRNRVNAAS